MIGLAKAGALPAFFQGPFPSFWSYSQIFLGAWRAPIRRIQTDRTGPGRHSLNKNGIQPRTTELREDEIPKIKKSAKKDREK